MKDKIVVISEKELEALLYRAIAPLQEEIQALTKHSDLETFTVKEASVLTGINYRNLLNSVKEGKLKSISENNKNHRVTRKNLIDYINNNKDE